MGYGAYSQSKEPRFGTDELSLLDRGVIYAIAHVRGGTEMVKFILFVFFPCSLNSFFIIHYSKLSSLVFGGRFNSTKGWKWYEDGKGLKKRNTFLDFIACAEFLIQKNYTEPSKLCVYGRSAGTVFLLLIALLFVVCLYFCVLMFGCDLH